MNNRKVRFPDSETRASLDSGVFLMGHVVESNGSHILIDYPGNSYGLLPARSAITIPDWHEQGQTSSLQVILVFENGNLSLPFILGVIGDDKQLTDRLHEIEKQDDRQDNKELEADTLMLSGKKEVILQCGKGSITLREDGKIIIKGVEVVSRASQANKIKGSTVCVN